MYRIAIRTVPLWLTRLSLIVLVLSIPLTVVCGIELGTANAAERGTVRFLLAIIGIYPGLFGSIFGAISIWVYVDACRHGIEYIFADEFTMRYPWPFGAKVYSWDEIAGVHQFIE